MTAGWIAGGGGGDWRQGVGVGEREVGGSRGRGGFGGGLVALRTGLRRVCDVTRGTCCCGSGLASRTGVGKGALAAAGLVLCGESCVNQLDRGSQAFSSHSQEKNMICFLFWLYNSASNLVPS